MDLELKFAPKQGRVDGKVIHRFKPLQSCDTLYLDGPGIEIRSASMNDKQIEFDKSEKGFTFRFQDELQVNKEYELKIEYKAFPKKGIYFIGWNDETGRSRKQIWTQGQGTDNRHWIPHYDTPNDKITTDIKVHFPSEYLVLSNGELKSKKKGKDGNTVWNYIMEQAHASYLIMLGIGDYRIKTLESESGKKLNLWYYPDHEDRVEATYRYSKKMFDFFENEIGVPYAWPSYSQIPVQDFMYGAMENTSATLFGDFFMVDERGYLDRNYVGVNAHELAHQWFGDLVTARTAKHHWLQESFATFYNMMYEREAFGQDHYEWGLRNATRSALKESKKNLRPIAHSQAGSVRHYPKGAHVLHMLRYVLGREDYNRGIKRYLQENKFENVDSEDLLIAFHDELGLSLNWFWKQWVHQGGEPHYKVDFKTYRKDNRHMAEYTVEQIHETSLVNGYYKMPVMFEVVFENGEKQSELRWVEDKFERVSFELPSDRQVAFALFDKASNIMKKLDFPKDPEMLQKQALRADHMIDRYDAIYAMRDLSPDEKRDFLKERFDAETFHAIKNEILEQLKNDKESLDLFKKAMNDQDARVRRAAISKNEILPESLKKSAEQMLIDSSYNNVSITLERLCASFPADCSSYLEKTKEEQGIKAKNIRIKWLELAHVNQPSDDYLMELLDYTTNSYDFLTRVSAAQTLQNLDHFSEEFFHNLADMIASSNSRMSRPAAAVLKTFNSKLRWKKEIKFWHQQHNYQFDWQRKKVEKLL